MKQGMKVLLLLFVSTLVRPAFVSTAAAADCFINCMEISGCWSGRPLSDPHGCRPVGTNEQPDQGVRSGRGVRPTI
jgi:hypothetical protein